MSSANISSRNMMPQCRISVIQNCELIIVLENLISLKLCIKKYCHNSYQTYSTAVRTEHKMKVFAIEKLFQMSIYGTEFTYKYMMAMQTTWSNLMDSLMLPIMLSLFLPPLPFPLYLFHSQTIFILRT